MFARGSDTCIFHLEISCCTRNWKFIAKEQRMMNRSNEIVFVL